MDRIIHWKKKQKLTLGETKRKLWWHDFIAIASRIGNDHSLVLQPRGAASHAFSCLVVFLPKQDRLIQRDCIAAKTEHRPFTSHKISSWGLETGTDQKHARRYAND